MRVFCRKVTDFVWKSVSELKASQAEVAGFIWMLIHTWPAVLPGSSVFTVVLGLGAGLHQKAGTV